MIDQEFMYHENRLGLLEILLLYASRADAIGALPLLECQMVVHCGVVLGPMNVFFKHWISLDSFKFGLEVVDGMTMGAAVGAATGVGKVVAIVLRLVAWGAPNAACQLGCWCNRFRKKTCQLPLPPPSFFTFLGSASMWPFLLK